MNQKTPDATVDDFAANGAASLRVELTDAGNSDEYLLNDIGLALRLLDETG